MGPGYVCTALNFSKSPSIHILFEKSEKSAYQEYLRSENPSLPPQPKRGKESIYLYFNFRYRYYYIHEQGHFVLLDNVKENDSWRRVTPDSGRMISTTVDLCLEFSNV